MSALGQNPLSQRSHSIVSGFDDSVSRRFLRVLVARVTGL